MSNLGTVLQNANAQLSPLSDSARLDAELLLAAVLGVERSYLFAWPERVIKVEEKQEFQALLARRLAGEPVAYLLGQQEFWSLSFYVGEGVLIPRPDTETLVEAALELGPLDHACVLDLGTGSGAVACALSYERPLWTVSAVDNSGVALSYASRNAEALGLANVECLESHWFDAMQQRNFDLIVSNPPYIEDNDKHLFCGDVRFEPSSALRSGVDGLDDIRAISSRAQAYLKNEGWLILEHGYQQALLVRELLLQAGFQNVAHRSDLAGHTRVTLGQKQDAAPLLGE